MNTKPKILVIDDELQIRRLLKLTFESNGFEVVLAESGKEGTMEALMSMPDLIILDLGLPDEDGTTVLRSLREWAMIPIIILSVRNSEEDIINCFDAGADDFITKPFRNGELLARVRSALRHIQSLQHDPLYSFGDLVVNLAARTVEVSGHPVKLTSIEYSLLSLFVQNAGRVLTHKFILHKIWGPGSEEKKEYVRVYIAQLRKVIENDPSRPQHIVTESQIGYRFTTIDEYRPLHLNQNA
jgi:two-component system KDP operon response regulator KdpE